MKDFNTALVIDDDKDLCMLIKAMLVNDIKDVNCAHTIEAGKEVLMKVMPDLVLLDNNLPDGQGINLIPEIKAVSPKTRIILVSAFQNLNSQAMALGADLFLEKPLSNARIRDALNSLQKAL